MSQFSEPQLERYSRQLLLPEVGGKGQRALLGARVAMVGAGGLGAPAILYLAAAGVGTIDVIDSDAVELSNLQRQIIHGSTRIGIAKAESARHAIAALNPEVKIVPHQTRLTKDNALEILKQADVILDGSDNFPTRYLVNDAAYFLRKPLVTGAILQWEGQVTAFPNDGAATSPCYRCLFPEMPEAGLIPSCQEAGVVGALAGVIGSLMANETIKILLGAGDTLAGRLLIFDALAARFREIKLRRDPACALNGDAPSIRELQDYAQKENCAARHGTAT
ncbi:thiazole biosynthesis adenylyltransferase ThiF [soil metagenome]